MSIRLRKNNQRFWTVLLTAACIMPLMTACSEVDGDPLSWIGPGYQSAEAKKRNAQDPATPRPIDPFTAMQPYQAAQGGTLGSLGFNLETYFAEGTDDPADRMQRLENAVVALHRDLKIMGLALQQMSAPAMPVAPVEATPVFPPIDNAPQPLTSETLPEEDMLEPADLRPVPAPVPAPASPFPPINNPPRAETLTPVPGVPATTTPPPPITATPAAPVPVPVTPPPVLQPIQTPPVTGTTPVSPSPAIAPPANSEALLAAGETQVNTGPKPIAGTSGKPGISSVRVGEHPDRVRLVFDVSGPTNFTADLDNAEGLLVIEIPQAEWRVPVQSETFSSPVIKSLKADPLNGGSMIVVQLKQDTEILSQSKMPAIAGGGQRIVIDLKK